MHDEPGTTHDRPDAYRRALPAVYGYLLPRCGSVAVAEDLTAETFLAAVAGDAAGGRDATVPSTAWLIGIARHKLVDHWRRAAREERAVAEADWTGAGSGTGTGGTGGGVDGGVDDPWERWLDVQAAHEALARLSGVQRAALTLRYLDGLGVADVARHVGRSVRATETLLVRSRAALRRVYEEGDRDGQ